MNNSTITISTDGPPCSYCTVSRWTKGDHKANIPQIWSNLISDEVCGSCIDTNITLADFDVLMSMDMRLSCSLEREKLRKLSFYAACDMFLDLVDELEGELQADETQGNGNTVHPAH